MVDHRRGYLAVARGLATAFTSAPWRAPDLVAAGRFALGRRPGWLPPLVADVLAAFPAAPLDRPRELATFLAESERLQRAADRARRRPLRVAHWVAAPTRMGPARWDVPVLHDLAELAAWLELSPGQLMWLADPRGQQRRAGDTDQQTYRYQWRARPGSPPRLLETPRPILKRVQRQLLHELLDRIPPHEAAHGFVPGRSVLSHARLHLGAQVVVTVDIANFFAQITPGRLYGVLRTAAYPEPVAYTVAGLCATRTPTWVLAAMPDGGTVSARQTLRNHLRSPHLAQGAPTSPAAANLACFGLDARLSGYARAADATYSRYADDLTFSGGAGLALSAPAFVRGVARIARAEDLPLNPSKSRVQHHGRRQVVTGVVVNERPNVARADYDRLRAVLHEARVRGPEVANRHGHPDFRASLSGRVEWVASVNPQRGHRLRADLDAIDWG